MTKNRYHHGDLREALIHEAALMLKAEGESAMTIRALGEKLGVSRTAMYRHFKDKNMLRCAVATDGFIQLAESLKKSKLKKKNKPLDGFRNVMEAYVLYATQNPEYYRLMFAESIISQSSSADLNAAATQALNEALDVIKECQDAGLIKKTDPQSLTNVLWSMLHGVSMLLLDGQIGKSSSRGMHSRMETLGDTNKKSIRKFVLMAVNMLIDGIRE